MHKNSPDRRFASVSEAAKYAACSRDTIRRRISDGTLPAYRFGPKVLRVDLDQLDKLLRPVPAGGQVA